MAMRRGLTPRTCKRLDRESTRLNSSHRCISYAVFCLKKKKKQRTQGHADNKRPARRRRARTHASKISMILHLCCAVPPPQNGFDSYLSIFFFFNDPATPEIYALSLHDALPIWYARARDAGDLVAHLELRQIAERGLVQPLAFESHQAHGKARCVELQHRSEERRVGKPAQL